MSDYTLRAWTKGMDNIHRPSELHEMAPNSGVVTGALRGAVNVDFTDAGNVRRRDGYEFRQDGNFHSPYVHGDYFYCVIDGALCRIDSPTEHTVLAVGIGRHRVSYITVNNDVYFTCAVRNGILRAGVLLSWGVSTPSAPALDAVSTGTLDGGTYQVACTLMSASGEESAPSNVVRRYASGGIQIVVPSFTEAKCNVYMTHANGDVFYKVETLTSAGVITIQQRPQYGRVLSTLGYQRAPMGDMIEYYRGRIYIVAGSVMWATRPLQYGLCDPVKDFIAFPSPVGVIKAVTDGLYVSSDAVYFYGGSSPEDFTVRKVHADPAFRFSGHNIPHTENILWMSPEGLIVGEAGGKVTRLQNTRIRPTPADEAIVTTMEADGIVKHIALCSKLQTPDRLGVGDFIQTEVIRRGDADTLPG